MLAGFYTIASGMLTRQREIDTISNNLVNSQTPGYRADRLVISDFEQELLIRQEKGNTQVLGGGVASTSAIVGEEVSLPNSGTVKSTGRELDMSINGNGYYNIQGTDGTVYLTRNGSFDVDQEGYLTLPGYGRVLGTNSAPIQVGNTEFGVTQNGEIYNETNPLVGTLLITAPAEGTVMVKQDNGLVRAPDGAAVNRAQNYTIAQRTLELSNVDMNREMTYLIEAQRAFQSCGSALQVIDALNRKAATQIGNV